MNLPDVPPTFRPPTPAERPWWWRLLTASGEEAPAEDPQRFVSQGDAESWIGETWRELVEQGVASVVLVEHERDVYGPMPLEA